MPSAVTRELVELTIGSQSAKLESAVLAPGLIGLYLVRATVPDRNAFVCAHFACIQPAGALLTTGGPVRPGPRTIWISALIVNAQGWPLLTSEHRKQT
jgi:hypothetical protein